MHSICTINNAVYYRLKYQAVMAFYIVTCKAFARQRVGKHVSEENARNSTMSFATQRQHASLRTEDGVFRGVRAEELS
jgi:hypothetical protein